MPQETAAVITCVARLPNYIAFIADPAADTRYVPREEPKAAGHTVLPEDGHSLGTRGPAGHTGHLTFVVDVIARNWDSLEGAKYQSGIRYSHNDQRFTQALGGWNSPTSYDSGRNSEGGATWMATAKYRFTPDVMLYARAATSFQPGRPNGSTPGIPLTVKGETLINYESGLKAESLDRKGLVDLSVFYIDWKNIQINVGYLANGGHAISEGLELTSSYSPLQGLILGFTAAYTQCKFISVTPAANYVLTGYQLSNVPKWSMSSTVDYAWALTNLWRAHVGSGFRWIGQEWSGFGAVNSHSGYPAVVLPAYSVLDLNASIVKGPLTLRAFARNAMDKRTYLQSGTYVDYLANPHTPVQIYNNSCCPGRSGSASTTCFSSTRTSTFLRYRRIYEIRNEPD